MIIHATILDRINRAIPVIGVPFYIYQAHVAIKEAKEDDAAYDRLIRGMGDTPKHVGHSLKQEWFLISFTASAILIGWLFPFLVLSKFLDFRIIFAASVPIAAIFDYLSGKIAYQLFVMKERLKDDQG